MVSSLSHPVELERFSKELRELIKEAQLQLSPKEIIIGVSENISLDSNAHSYEDDQGNYILLIKPNALNEVILSHEILHLIVKAFVPQLIRVVKFDLVGIIGTELQGYLEHRWIRAEQERRGILTAEGELDLFPDLLAGLGPDDPVLGNNIQRILFLNNLMDTYPAVFEEYEDDFVRRNPQSLRWAERIMSHYPNEMSTQYSVARSCTVSAIQEWKSFFQECGLKPELLRYLLSVIPVFSQMQLDIPTNEILGLWPEAIRVGQTAEISSVLYTLEDGQGCTLLTMKQGERDLLSRCFNNTALGDFLKLVKIPYLIEYQKSLQS